MRIYLIEAEEHPLAHLFVIVFDGYPHNLN